MKEPGKVTVEFYGIPRQRAGCAELVVPALTLAETLKAVRCACPGLSDLFPDDTRLSPHYLVSINGQTFGPDLNHLLVSGDRVLLLSADAGG